MALTIGPGAARLMLSGLLIVTLGGCGHDAAEQAAGGDQKNGPVMADADMLHRRIVGHTIKGHMGAGATREFFAPDGSIHGPGYRAEWVIQSDRLCLNYDESPQLDCYRIRLEGDKVQWLRNGEIHGDGRLVAGNPDNL